MTFSSTRRFCGGALVVVALVYLSSCAVPLAPGYQIEKQSITVRFVPGNPPHLAIRAQYRLANVGTTPLDSIELGLPDEKGFGLANLRVKIDGHEVTPRREPGQTSAPAEGETAVSEMWPDTWRVPFASHWSRRQRKNLVLEYDLAAHSTTDPRISVGSNAFYLNDSGWFPDPISAKALFAKDVVRPDPSDLIVDVPANFVATASGERRKTHKAGGETELRFRIGASDFDPYVLAGQYQEQKVSTHGVTVAIWTFKPIPADQAQKTAAQIATAANFYAENFGLLPRSMKTIFDVKPGEREKEDLTLRLERGHWLPGVVYGPTLEALGAGKALDGGDTLGIDFDDYISKFGDSVELPATWFEHMIAPRPKAWLLPSGLSLYASEALHGSAGESRTESFANFLSEYDRYRAEAVEKPITALTDSDPQDQLQIAYVKMQLFLFALEDQCGQQNVTHAITHMVYALRGQEYGYNDFRVALEQECHQDLSSMFATWLDQKGIPADFRARYENATSK